MIIRTLAAITGSDREIHAASGNWISRRLVLDDDAAGFSLHETIITAGSETRICYKNHIEAVYCVGGEGEIEDIKSGVVHPIKDGTMYLLNEHDDHWLRGFTEMRLICAFNPPLIGAETHNEEGAYAAHQHAKQWETLRNQR